MTITAHVIFKDSKKEKVSGIDMLNRVSTMLFGAYGEHIELVGVERLRWPYPLHRDEHALVSLTERGDRMFRGVRFKSFYVEFVGTKSNRVVMKGYFTIVMPD